MVGLDAEVEAAKSGSHGKLGIVVEASFLYIFLQVKAKQEVLAESDITAVDTTLSVQTKLM